jgi:tetratricopeptide (TPR) repeat protein
MSGVRESTALLNTSALLLWQRLHAWLSRHVLLLAIAFLVPAFLLTGWMASAYHDAQHRLAATWYRQGEADQRDGRVAQAIDDYRAALSYSHENPSYRLRLAQALAQAGHLDAASADLHRLWEDQPANSVVNLELARLAARRDQVIDAIRYYNNAIYGIWPTDPAIRQRDTQIELIDYLMRRGRMADARAGLIALAADVPPDAGVRVALGERLARTGDDGAALQQFRDALDVEPRSKDALALAGAAAFRLGDFPGAERYLRAAVREGDPTPETAAMFATAQAAVALDPFQRGLTSAERVRRVRSAVDQVTQSFAACVATLSPDNPPGRTEAGVLHARLAALAPTLHTREARDAQMQQDAMDLVFDMEDFLVERCAPLGPADAALRALRRSSRGRP